MGLGIVGCAGLFLLSRTSPPTVISIGIVSEAFTGNWKYMHVPLPLDRVFFLVGLAALVMGGFQQVRGRRLVLQPIHLLLLGVAAYGVCSALAAHTIGTSLGFYALLDRYGFLPFLMFALAPLLYGSVRHRNTLLIALVVFGLYLSVTAVFEGIGLTKLVFPPYILNPNLGIETGRARGPFLNSDADGLAMILSAGASVIAWKQWHNRLVRLVLAVEILCSVAGVFFTLTRAVWLGAIFGVVCLAVVERRARRIVVPFFAVATLGVGGALLVHHVRDRVVDRVTTTSSIWDRLNTDNAAFRLIARHPIFGIGWETFVTKGTNALRQAPTYPMTGEGLEIHDVFLSHLTELGLFGGSLWIVAFFWVVGNAAFRRGPPELYPWRLLFVCYGGAVLAVAAVTPLANPEANLVFWMLAGLVARDRYTTAEPSVEQTFLQSEHWPGLEADLGVRQGTDPALPSLQPG